MDDIKIGQKSIFDNYSSVEFVEEMLDHYGYGYIERYDMFSCTWEIEITGVPEEAKDDQ